jgi:hypothetical protein
MMKRLLALIFLLGFVPSARALTLTQMITAVRRNVRDTSSTTTLQRYSDSLITDFLNEGQRDFAAETFLIERSTAIATTASIAYYALPTNFLSVAQAYNLVSTTTVDLERVTRAFVYEQNPDWATITGSPTQYWIRNDETQSIQSQIALYPVPTGASTGTLTVHYYARPTDLSAASDVPFDNMQHLDSYNHALIFYATGRLKLAEGKGDEAEAYMNLYNSLIENASDRFRAKSVKNEGPKLFDQEKKQ